MAVSEDAVSTLAGVSNVYVIDHGQARQQMVSLGPRVGKLFELLGGLKGDEILAASNLTLLATGVPVRIAAAAGTDVPPESIPTPGEKSADRDAGGRP
jgi:hypothetical protein